MRCPTRLALPRPTGVMALTIDFNNPTMHGLAMQAGSVTCGLASECVT